MIVYAPNGVDHIDAVDVSAEMVIKRLHADHRTTWFVQDPNGGRYAVDLERYPAFVPPLDFVGWRVRAATRDGFDILRRYCTGRGNGP